MTAMPVRYIDDSDVDALIDSDVRQSLFTDSSGTYSETLFNRLAEFASIKAKAHCQQAGYDTGDDTDGSTAAEIVKLVTLVFFISAAYGRKQLAVPPATLDVLAGFMEAVGEGVVPLPDLTPDALNAVGGVKFSTGTGSDGQLPPVFCDLDEAW